MKFLLLALVALAACSSISESELSERIDRSCSADVDCKLYVADRICTSLCARTNPANDALLSRVEKTCDATLWDPAKFECICQQGTCAAVS